MTKETVLQTALQGEQKARPEGGEALAENVDALGQGVHESQRPRQTKARGKFQLSHLLGRSPQA